MKNFKNEPRQIGIELEFSGLNPKEAAEIVNDVVAGSIKEVHRDLYEVESKLGTFELETDASFVKNLSQASKENQDNDSFDYEGILRDTIQSFSEEFIPTELVGPPIEIKDLPEIVQIQRALTEAGAKGSTDAVHFIFGAQLNPEVESLETEYILRILQSFLMLSDWLKNQIQIELVRKLSAFAADFPRDYQLKILAEDYAPDQDRFIDDYLALNPTRYRSLDLLPLLSFIDRDRVMNNIPDQKVNTRPTFHYRLPNSYMSMDSWNIGIEWKRWLLVEKLAKSDEQFRAMQKRYLQRLRTPLEFSATDWLIESNNFVEFLR